MDILPDDIQDTIYKYKHQMEYRNVMEHLKVSVCYCGWCGQRQWTWTDCDCGGEDEWNEIWDFYDEMYGIEN